VDKNTLNEAEESKKEAEDGKKEEDDGSINVHMKTRLDNRILDLRTPAKQAIFRL
jgi:aspartyl-tRNA synthetase